ncbi:unnamed protein product [Rhizoctonia solani]|uniref:Uncharacterized protein n=1 Tax=Rhizoctonia solani TaxID=456999 RepID=A0A8H3C477_9AGAM|nr:unnamed protein product [Rhizoctonia solani]
MILFNRIFFVLILAFLTCNTWAHVGMERSQTARDEQESLASGDIEGLVNNITTRLDEVSRVIRGSIVNSTLPLLLMNDPRNEANYPIGEDLGTATPDTQLHIDAKKKYILVSLITDIIKDVVQLCTYASNSNQEDGRECFAKMDNDIGNVLLAFFGIKNLTGLIYHSIFVGLNSLGVDSNLLHRVMKKKLPKIFSLLSA